MPPLDRTGTENRLFDVAALELHEPSVISLLQTNWQFLTLQNVAAPMPVGRSFLTGFPASLISKTIAQVHRKPVTIYSDPLHEVPPDAEDPVTPSLDLFIQYGREAEALDGTLVPTPNLKGTSGASVWQLQTVPPDVLWSAERAIRVIGVQSAFAHSQYFRAQNWWAVARVLANADVCLQEHLTTTLHVHRQPT